MPESAAPADALLCLRAAVSADPEDPLALVRLRDASGNDVDEIRSVSTVAFLSKGSAAPEHVFEVHAPTRMLRTRELSSREGGAPKMESEPDAFLPLGALIFAILQRNERAGSYLRNATTAQIVPIPALERGPILEYLSGKRSTWDGVVTLSDIAEKEATAPSEVATAAPTQGDAAERPPTVKRPFVPDAVDAEFVRNLRSKYELVLLTRDDALRGSMTPETDDDTPGSRGAGDLLGLRAMIAPRIEAAKKRSAAPNKSSTSSSRAPSSAVNPARKSRAQDPIILLSNSPTALVNMFNVKALLQDGVFISPEEARQQAGGIPELVVTIRAPSSDEPASGNGSVSLSRRILVVDSAEAVNRLGSGAPGSDQDPWTRVICVFTTGQAWQFKSYRWSDPRDLFRNGTLSYLTLAAMGVYVRWTNEAPSAQVKNWNVTHLQVDRTKRHTDKQLVAFFWRSLDSWVQRKKPRLQL